MSDLTSTDHPLALGSLAVAVPVSPPPAPSRVPRMSSSDEDGDSIESGSSTTAAAPVGSVSYSDSDEDESDPRLRRDPFAMTRAQMSAADSVPAPRPRSEMLGRAQEFWRAMHASADADQPPGLIDESVVRAYLFDYGCPEQPSGSRGLLWKLLLGYLPWDRRQWHSRLTEQRAAYESFVRELTSNPFDDLDQPAAGDAKATTSTVASSGARSGTLKFEKASAMNDPLSDPLSSLKSTPLTTNTASAASTAATAATESKWAAYYKDNAIRDEIEKDVRRTYSTFHFFAQRVRPVESSAEEVRRADAAERARIAAGGAASARSTPTDMPTHMLFEYGAGVPSIPRVDTASSAKRARADETHHDVIQRILFIYAKLHPAVRYIQGMNELLAPIYYVFAHNGVDLRSFDPVTGEEVPDSFSAAGVSALLSGPPTSKSGISAAEADAFFCFSAVMGHMRDRFVKSLDLAPTGVLAAIADLNALLRRIDPDLWSHLNTIGVDPRFYSFRWLTLLLSQEFELPDVLRLWDALFAAEPEEAMADRDATAGDASGPTVRSVIGSGTGAENKHLVVQHLNDVCCGMLVMLRPSLINVDFSGALKLLQSGGQGIDVQRLLFKAQEIRSTRRTAAANEAAAKQAKERSAQAMFAATPSPSSSTSATSRSERESHPDFTHPQPRPGETKNKGQALHIALREAPDYALSAPHPSTSPSPPPPTDDSPVSSPAAAFGTSVAPPASLTASVSSALSGAASEASSLAGGVAALVVSSAHAAAPLLHAGLDAVEHAVHSATAIAAAAAAAATEEESPEQENTPSPRTELE